MTNKIALTASMRSNLLSLKNTQSLLNKTQDHLSTGYKVNSAMDNPSSYFTAQALNSRANDLSTLLDSIGQAISTLEVADQGITTLQSYVEQAKSVANSARDTSNVASKATTNSVAFDPNNARTDLVSDYVNVTAGTAQKVLTGVNTAAISADDELGTDLGIANNQTLNVKIGSETKTYTFKTTAALDNEVQLDATVQEFLDKVAADFGGADKVKAEIVDGQVSITSLDGKDVKITSDRQTANHTSVSIALTGANLAPGGGGDTTTLKIDTTHLVDVTNLTTAEEVAEAINDQIGADGYSASVNAGKVEVANLNTDTSGSSPAVYARPTVAWVNATADPSSAAADGSAVTVNLAGTSVSEKLGLNKATGLTGTMSSESAAAAGREFSIRMGDATKMTGTSNLRADQTLEDLGLADRQSIDIIVGDKIHTYTIGEGTDQISKSSTVQEFMDNIVYDIGRTKIKAEIVDGNMSISTLDNSTLEIRSSKQTETHEALIFANDDIGTATGLADVELTSTDGNTVVTVDLSGAATTAEGVAKAINEDAKAVAAGFVAEVNADNNLVIYNKKVGDVNPDITFHATSGAPTAAANSAAKTIEMDGTSFNELVGFEPSKTVEVTDDMTVEKFRQAINNLDGISADFDMKGHLVISGEQGDDLVMVDAAGSNVLKNLYGNDIVSATNGSNERATYAKQFDNLLEQIDQLVQDTSYKGVNLLKGDNLLVNFNETRTSSLNIKGVTFNSVGLGFTVSENEWISNESIDKALNQITKATSLLRAQAAEFGQNLSTVQIREDFTQNMINNLQSGADKLTLADMNEEAANMLALQTRQQLGVNSLSLASQAAQSVLQLF